MFAHVVNLLWISVRLTLRHKPVLRDRLFTAVLVGAFAHGSYLVYPFYFFHFKYLYLLFQLLIISITNWTLVLQLKCNLLQAYIGVCSGPNPDRFGPDQRPKHTKTMKQRPDQMVPVHSVSTDLDRFWTSCGMSNGPVRKSEKWKSRDRWLGGQASVGWGWFGRSSRSGPVPGFKCSGLACTYLKMCFCVCLFKQHVVFSWQTCSDQIYMTARANESAEHFHMSFRVCGWGAASCSGNSRRKFITCIRLHASYSFLLDFNW